jgi:putative ABC transport system permease protein
MVLAKGTNPSKTEVKMPGLLEKYQEQSLWTDFHQEEYLLQPISEYHLENRVNDDVGLKGNPQQLKIYSIVGILVLLLGCINYMNLAIARSINRAKEVGLRKVVGAVRGQLIGQFLTESIFLALVSFVVALILLTFLLPVFSELVDRSIDNTLLLKHTILPILFILILIVGIVSGSYPAFFMSVLKPVAALKNKIEKRQTSFNFQRLLTFFENGVQIFLNHFIIFKIICYVKF